MLERDTIGIVTNKKPRTCFSPGLFYGKRSSLVSCSCRPSGFDPVLDDCLQFLDSVEVRRLVALLSLVIDLVAIDIDLQHTQYTGAYFNRNCTSASIHKLVDHPGRNTVVLSGYTIDDLDIYQTFASHNRSS